MVYVILNMNIYLENLHSNYLYLFSPKSITYNEYRHIQMFSQNVTLLGFGPSAYKQSEQRNYNLTLNFPLNQHLNQYQNQYQELILTSSCNVRTCKISIFSGPTFCLNERCVSNPKKVSVHHKLLLGNPPPPPQKGGDQRRSEEIL